jgi:DNA polymerase kappa
MPGFLGKKMCPKLLFVRSNKEKYGEISENEFMRILREYDPNLESCGLDEANLDVTEYLVENGMDSQEGRIFLSSKIRNHIKSEMRMTCSAGIACNKMLAKICSELDKPDGQTILSFE